jgi:hypothetical protein
MDCPFEKYCTDLPFESGVVIRQGIADCRLQIADLIDLFVSVCVFGRM